MRARKRHPRSEFEHQQRPVKAPQIDADISQRVQMSRAELDLYVQDGRPTGLLLRSVAELKGLSVAAVAGAAGISAPLVESIFSGNGAGTFKRAPIKRVSTVLGIDLGAMRLASGQVHVFNLDKVSTGTSSKGLLSMLRGVGLLARGAVVAELKVGNGLRSMMWRGRMHVAQSSGFRALFIGSFSRRFRLEHLPSASWVCGNRALSIIPVENRELLNLLMAKDLIEGEYDELFQGSKALTWDDVRVASRVNGVNKAELMGFIESRAHEKDLSDDEALRLAASQSHSALSLVHSDTRLVANG